MISASELVPNRMFSATGVPDKLSLFAMWLQIKFWLAPESIKALNRCPAILMLRVTVGPGVKLRLLRRLLTGDLKPWSLLLLSSNPRDEMCSCGDDFGGACRCYIVEMRVLDTLFQCDLDHRSRPNIPVWAVLHALCPVDVPCCGSAYTALLVSG